MNWTNFHTHTLYCDGRSTPEAFIREAIEQDILSLGFSSHAPLPIPCHWVLKREKLSAYVQEINKFKSIFENRIEIFCGLEIDYIPSLHDEIIALAQSVSLDYTIGAIHFMDPMPDGTFWTIEADRELFVQGLRERYNDEPEQLVEAYFRNSRDMIRTLKPDMVAHIDKLKMQHSPECPVLRDESFFRAQLLETLRVAAEEGVIVEINTRGTYRGRNAQLFPDPMVLGEMHRMGIPVCVNSDAHGPDELTRNFRSTYDLLLKAGYETVRVLTRGKWVDIPFSNNGLDKEAFLSVMQVR